MSSVLVVPTGTANTASVAAALKRLGVRSRMGVDGSEIEAADQVVIPGVGSFGSATDAIDRIDARTALTERISAGRPTLAICVGMQILAKSSAESPGASGLGVLDSHVSRFSGRVQVPQFGWNRVEPGPGCRFVSAGWAYFANSYRLTNCPAGWRSAATSHDGEFVSVLERDGVLACQFHPELSGSWGAGVLNRWLTKTGGP